MINHLGPLKPVRIWNNSTENEMGWAGYNLGHTLNPRKFQTVIVSPRSHFVFTPLLASTATGTLEFRTAIEPVRRSRGNSPEFFQARAVDVSFVDKTVTLDEAVTDPRQGLAPVGGRFGWKSREDVDNHIAARKEQRRVFDLQYDKLVIAVGAYSQTFNTPGVKEHAHFLKDVGDARRIRRTILTCYETAALPTTLEHVRRQLLNFVITGGGPTGIEFAAELHDLIRDDLNKLYPHLKGLARITVHDVAPTVLNMFDRKLSDYAVRTFKRENIDVKTESVVQALEAGLPDDHTSNSATSSNGKLHLEPHQPGVTLKLKGQPPQGAGMVVWSTGLMPNPFIAKSMSLAHSFPERCTIFKGDPEVARNLQWSIATDSRTGSVLTNDRLRVILEAKEAPEASNDAASSTSTSSSSTNPGQDPTPTRAYMTDVYALGDCAQITGTTYPATAQVANQKATWLARHLNHGDLPSSRFHFRDLGVMAYVGGWRAIFQGGPAISGGRLADTGLANVSGRAAWIIWRTAYLVRSVSWRNKVLIPVYWVVNW
ncbi:MAG: hypothetical protein Q9162_004429 [Coniocarpon cinnabarinum]